MRACMDENGMKFNETQIDDLTKAMFDDADPDHRGGKIFIKYLQIYHFKNLF